MHNNPTHHSWHESNANQALRDALDQFAASFCCAEKRDSELVQHKRQKMMEQSWLEH